MAIVGWQTRSNQRTHVEGGQQSLLQVEGSVGFVGVEEFAQNSAGHNTNHTTVTSPNIPPPHPTHVPPDFIFIHNPTSITLLHTQPDFPPSSLPTAQ